MTTVKLSDEALLAFLQSHPFLAMPFKGLVEPGARPVVPEPFSHANRL